MRILLAFLLALSLGACAEVDRLADTARTATQTTSSQPSGDWNTSYGTMRFSSLADGAVRAVYSGEDGVLTGRMSGRTYSGRWVEPGSNRTCSTEVNGSDHWGQFSFTFNAAMNSFEGVWGYCGDTPTQGWTGTRS